MSEYNKLCESNTAEYVTVHSGLNQDLPVNYVSSLFGFIVTVVMVVSMYWIF